MSYAFEEVAAELGQCREFGGFWERLVRGLVLGGLKLSIILFEIFLFFIL